METPDSRRGRQGQGRAPPEKLELNPLQAADHTHHRDDAPHGLNGWEERVHTLHTHAHKEGDPSISKALVPEGGPALHEARMVQITNSAETTQIGNAQPTRADEELDWGNREVRGSTRHEEAPVPDGVAAHHRPRKALQSNSAEPHQRHEVRKYQRIIPEAIRAAGDALLEKGLTGNEIPGRRHTRRRLPKGRQQRSLRSLPLGGAEMGDATTAGAARERSGVPATAPSGDLPVCVRVLKRPRAWCTPSRRIRSACTDRKGEIGWLGEHEGSPRINNPFDRQGTSMAPLRSAPAPFPEVGEGIASPPPP